MIPVQQVRLLVFDTKFKQNKTKKLPAVSSEINMRQLSLCQVKLLGGKKTDQLSSELFDINFELTIISYLNLFYMIFYFIFATIEQL